MKRLADMTEPELKTVMTNVARGIEAQCVISGVEKPLFVCVLFNDPKVAQYISNCQRADVIEAMRETADRLERKEDVTR